MEWIPFEEGEYIVETALLIGSGTLALTLSDATLVIFRDRSGQKRMRGYGTTRPALMVDLLEDDDVIDMLVDLGESHKYRLAAPRIQSGKVFSPQAQSTVQFSPSRPWTPVAPAEFSRIVEGLEKIDV